MWDSTWRREGGREGGKGRGGERENQVISGTDLGAEFPNFPSLRSAVGPTSLHASAHWRPLDFSCWGWEEVKTNFFSGIGYCCFLMNLLTNVGNFFLVLWVYLFKRKRTSMGWYIVTELYKEKKVVGEKSRWSTGKKKEKVLMAKMHKRKRLRWQQIQWNHSINDANYVNLN